MLGRATFWNTLPDGVAVLELPGDELRFVPLRETAIAGEVAGPLAALSVTHTFGFGRADFDRPIEALYRFPLPGDAAITAVSVRFGATAIDAELADREEAERRYTVAKDEGRGAALLTRESPDVFTLQLAGLRPDEPIVVTTRYAQLCPPSATGWSLRLPLTTAPRYVREDERGSRAAAGQPLLTLRDPGHRFALDLLIRAAGAIVSPTHQLAVAAEEGGQRVRLRDGSVIPDRDCVIEWRPREATRPILTVLTEGDAATGETYFLALLAPPPAPAPETIREREAILLVDRSGSMSGAKWEAANWAAGQFLRGLGERDTFALGLFSDRADWATARPEGATTAAVGRASAFLAASNPYGGTNLGVALEQALGLPRDRGERARHLLIVTDAEVSDADRILRLADEEARRAERRRISVLCIDAAPNGYLATTLAERGGGVSRFLTSDPEQGDITGALDTILADWAAPIALDLRLRADGAAQIEGAQGAPAPTVSLGDLPAGRPVWAIGRLPQGAAAGPFAVADRAGTVAETVGEPLAGGALPSALRALFGARRVLALEQLGGAGYGPEELRAALARLGYDAETLDAGAGGRALYQENVRAAAQGALRGLLVAEALRYGLASAETAFVAVRREAGERIAATVVVANALPAGWSPGFAARGGASFMAMAMPAAPRASRSSDQRYVFRQTGGRSGFLDKLTGAFSSAPPPTPAPLVADTQSAASAAPLFAGVPRAVDGVAILFDAGRDDPAALPSGGRLARLLVRLPEGLIAGRVDPSLLLDLYVDDLAAPRVSVGLAALAAQGGTRPLNLAWRPGQALRIALRDPLGLCAAGGLELSVSLE